MALRFLLVSLVAGLGFEIARAASDVESWARSGRDWVDGRMADAFRAPSARPSEPFAGADRIASDRDAEPAVAASRRVGPTDCRPRLRGRESRGWPPTSRPTSPSTRGAASRRRGRGGQRSPTSTAAARAVAARSLAASDRRAGRPAEAAPRRRRRIAGSPTAVRLTREAVARLGRS